MEGIELCGQQRAHTNISSGGNYELLADLGFLVGDYVADLQLLISTLHRYAVRVSKRAGEHRERDAWKDCFTD